MRTGKSLIALLLLCTGTAFANVPAPPSITLELCGDVDVDEVQKALALEYWDDGDHSKTRVIVACRGQEATLRILGPDHPEGRITDINLKSVDPIAKPRVIAMLAAELWTAPEPSPAAPPTVAAPPLDQPPSTDKPPGLHRGRFTIGLVSSKTRRITRVNRDSAFQGVTGNVTSLRFEIPVWSYFQLFGKFGEADTEGMVASWYQSEFGISIPVLRSFLSRKARLEWNAKWGGDSIETGSSFDTLSSLEYMASGLRLAFATSPRVKLQTWSSVLGADDHNNYVFNLLGIEFGAGASYEFSEHFLLRATARVRSLEGGSGYVDQQASLDFGLAFLR